MLYIDIETRSGAPLKRGLYNYMHDSDFAIILVSWAVDDEPVRLWEPLSEEMPRRLLKAIKSEMPIVAHNAQFERLAFNISNIFGVKIPPQRFYDSMVCALSCGLPAGLGQLSKLFKLEGDGKLDSGKALINLFCVKKAAGFITSEERPMQWDEFRKYAINDVVAMRTIYKKLPKVNYPNLEHQYWVLDQTINSRGLPVDIEMAKKAVKVFEVERDRLTRSTSKNTDGEVGSATQTARLLEFLNEEYDLNLANLQADTIEERLGDPNLPEGARHLLEIRSQISQNAAAKYKRVLENEFEGRLYNTLQFLGASRTGRDAGRVFQPQNLKRPTVWFDAEDIDAAIEDDIELVKTGHLPMVRGDMTMDTLGSLVRSVIVAPEGKRFVQADLANIEGRALVWLSGEEWKLKFFRDFDAGKIKFDNYVAAYAKAMNIKPEKVTGHQRDIGKVMELGLGYGGGVNAFLQFSAVYDLDISELAESVWETALPVDIEAAADRYDWMKENGFHGGLPLKEFAACEYLKTQWREAHPLTVQFWKDLENAFRSAIRYENSNFQVRHLIFRRQGSYLYIRLPSGRCLVYADPRIGDDGQITFLGSVGKNTARIKTYSGKLSENVSSGVARDILIHRLPDMEAEGYPVILRVHDEILAETPDDFIYSAEGLCEIMTRPYKWSKGLPLAAEGHILYRYRKT